MIGAAASMNVERKLTKLDIASWAGFGIFAISSVILAICLPEISRTFATNLSEGGGMETARTLVLILVLLLAGMLAQRWGKKRFLTLGLYLITLGLFLSSLAQNYLMLLAAVMVMGIGGGFIEALLNPLIVDIHHKESGKYLNVSHAFYPLGIVLASMLFGELLTLGISWRLIFQIAAVITFMVAILFTVLRFPPTVRDNSAYPKLFAGVLSLGGFWLFALAIALGGGVESALLFWSRSYVGSYLSDIPRAGAIAVAVFAGAMAAGRFLTAYLANKMSLSNILIGSALLGVGVSVLIPFATNLYFFYALLAVAGLATASFWPTILAEADSYLKANTTILFVLLSSVGMIGYGLAPWIIGLIGDSSELRAGLIVIPLLFVALIITLLIERSLKKRSKRVLVRAPQHPEL